MAESLVELWIWVVLLAREPDLVALHEVRSVVAKYFDAHLPTQTVGTQDSSQLDSVGVGFTQDG